MTSAANTGALARRIGWHAERIVWDTPALMLAADAAELVTDMAAAMLKGHWYENEHGRFCVWCSMRPPAHSDDCEGVALLARFAELEARAAR